MIRQESPASITVVMPGGTEFQLAPADIVSRTQLNQSLMPAGLFDALPIEQVSDLIAFLASPEQVPLTD